MNETYTIDREALGKPFYCKDCETVQYAKQLKAEDNMPRTKIGCAECSKNLATIYPDKAPDSGKFKMEVEHESVRVFMHDKHFTDIGPKEEIINRLDNIMTDEELEEIEKLVREL